MRHLKSILIVVFAVVFAAMFTGCATGNHSEYGYMDTQQQEFEADLADELRERDIEIERMPDGALKLHLNSRMLFDNDSVTIKPAFRRSLDKLARVIRKYDRTAVHVIGYTDNVGTRSYNKQLSEDRAQTVANHLNKYGIAKRRLSIEGRGESEPRASNSTENGRRINRRVDIYLIMLAEYN